MCVCVFHFFLVLECPFFEPNLIELDFLLHAYCKPFRSVRGVVEAKEGKAEAPSEASKFLDRTFGEQLVDASDACIFLLNRLLMTQYDT